MFWNTISLHFETPCWLHVWISKSDLFPTFYITEAFLVVSASYYTVSMVYDKVSRNGIKSKYNHITTLSRYKWALNSVFKSEAFLSFYIWHSFATLYSLTWWLGIMFLMKHLYGEVLKRKTNFFVFVNDRSSNHQIC